MATKSVSKGKPQSRKGASSEAKEKPARKRSAEGSAVKTKESADTKAKRPSRSKVAAKSEKNEQKSAPSGDGVAHAKATRRTSSNGHGSSARAEGKRASTSTESKKPRSTESRKAAKPAKAGNGHVARDAESPAHEKGRHTSPKTRKAKSSREVQGRPEAGHDAAMVATTLHQAMESHASSHSLGHVTRDARFDWGDVENPDLHPELAFVSYDRWAAYRHVPTSLTWHVVPDLVVEVLDESEKTEEIGPRLADYFKAGVNRIWVVDPRDLRVFDYQSASEYELLSGNDRLSGGRILPGFEVALSELEKGHE